MTAPLDRRIGVAHGLRLHVRDWAPEDPRGLPVVCLPGLSRPLEDFCELAEFLSAGAGRRVVAISARGRGGSDRDPKPERYAVPVETADALSVMDALSIGRAHVVGTSRGGLQAMTMAALRPGALASVVLNDIGPVIDPQGLIRIRGYLSEPSVPADWAAATAAVQRLHGARFPALGREAFERMARRTWRDGPNGLQPNYDPALTATFGKLDLEKPLPPLWPLFDALKEIPMMALRGEHSDILGRPTLAEMARRRPDLRIHEVLGQAHAPQLADRPSQDAIAGFLDATGPES